MRHRLTFALACLLLVFCAIPANAAVARDGTPVECTDAVAGDTTINCTMTINSVSNGLLLCAIGSNNNVDINPAIAWDTAGVNQSLTQVTNAESSSTRYLSFWYLINPTAGASKTVGLTNLSSAARDGVICQMFSGAHQTTATDCGGCSSSGNVDVNTQGAGTTVATTGTITSATGEILFNCLMKSNSGAPTFDSGDTANDGVIHDQTVGTGSMACGYDEGGASDTLTWTWTGTTSGVTMTVNVNDAGGGGGGGTGAQSLGLGIFGR